MDGVDGIMADSIRFVLVHFGTPREKRLVRDRVFFLLVFAGQVRCLLDSKEVHFPTLLFRILEVELVVLVCFLHRIQVHQLLLNRAINPHEPEGQVGLHELVVISLGKLLFGVLNYAFNRLVLLKKLHCGFEPNSLRRGEVVATSQNAYFYEFLGPKGLEAVVWILHDVFKSQFHSVVVTVQLVQTDLRSEHKQIRVFCDHEVDQVFLAEISELSICLVRSEDEFDSVFVVFFESILDLIGQLRTDENRLLEVFD